MNKKALTLVISLGTAALLCAASVIVTAKAGNAASESTSDISANTIDGTITSIKYENSGSSAVELILDGEQWKLAGNTGFPLSQSVPTSMMNFCKDVSATRYVGESDNFAEYGLDAPQTKITVTADKSVTYLIGSKNTHTGDYYFAVDGEKSVYTVDYSFVSTFMQTPEQMAQIENPPVYNVNEVNSVEIVQNGEHITLRAENTQDKESGAESSSSAASASSSSESSSSSEVSPSGSASSAASSDISASISLGSSISVSQSASASAEAARKYTLKRASSTVEISSDKAESFLYSLNSVAFTECVAYNPDSLADYGLENPIAKITVNYTKAASASDEAAPSAQSYTLLVGGGSPDGSRYIMLSGTDMVCLTDAGSISDVLNAMLE